MAVIFKKNETKSMNDLGGSSPLLVFGIGWNNKKKGGLSGLIGKRYQADLDLSCVVYDKNDDRIDCVWYAQLNSKDGAIRHKGDDTVGVDVGDDEVVIMDLNKLNDEAKTLFFVISSFSGNSFNQVEHAYWRLFDGATKRTIGRFNFSSEDEAQAKIVMRLQKDDSKGLDNWVVKALDETATGKNVQEVFSEIRGLLEG